MLGESRGVVIADAAEHAEVGVKSIRRNRLELRSHISQQPAFGVALEPIDVGECPSVCHLMAEAAWRANVGPMAAVAGTLAEIAVADMLESGAKLAVVENGGEIAAHTLRSINAGLIVGTTPLSRRLAFKISPETSGVATSSGRYSYPSASGTQTPPPSSRMGPP